MINTNLSVLSWNVRELNYPARRFAVHELATAHRPTILCLQETKLETWSADAARKIGGTAMEGCAVLPAAGTKGGVAIFWNTRLVDIATHSVGCFSITAKVSAVQCSSSFWLTTVYGPADDARKEAFLAELINAAPPSGEPWLITGYFNVIYEARDKSNLNLNRRIMGQFRRAIDSACLKEIKCKNRRFTWSNERESPTLVSIDKIFCNSEWDALFPNHMLMAASTACSEHCPLLLANAAPPARRPSFKFESFWTRFPRFQETVERAWQRPVASSCPIATLKLKLKRTAFYLRIWARSLFSDAKAKINTRRRKNFIHSLQASSSTATSHDDKDDVAYRHFTSHLGTKQTRGCSINWDAIDLPCVQNAGLDNPFTEPEVWAAILATPVDKAPGPDGFSGAFFRACWNTIKHDVMAVFDHFYRLAGGNFSDLNSAMIA
ncbi:uncharacterized protein [Aegilops tauschii subsp. strangulata]|uniref:uncharacterized protein n=1 Tax=Aegilops tauschii subsp. strangulata TaxID=200361 RepID=UPI003CC8BBAB